MLDWLGDNTALAWWLGSISVAMFIASIVGLPIMLARLRADYFQSKERGMVDWNRHPHALRIMAKVFKNLLGIILLLAGLLMLALPGQGLIAILVAVILLDFPGKFRLERWIITRPKVYRAVNWIRRKANKPPFDIGDGDCRVDSSGRIDEDVPCPHCGYNRRGLLKGTACPECGRLPDEVMEQERALKPRSSALTRKPGLR